MKRSSSLPLRSFRLVAEPELAPQAAALLAAEGFAFEPEPFSPLCFRLLEEPFPLGGSLAALFGYVYIQDRSSMLPPLALAPQRGGAALDLCASPGSKTGLLAQLLGPEGFALANEPSRQRLATLRANLRAMSLVQCGSCSFPGEALPLRPGSWESVLLDPPCSGWGTAEKNPGVLDMWKGERLGPLLGLQRALLKKAAELLAPGGVLVYSTCTTNSGENEEQVAWAEGELGLFREALEPFEGFAWDERPGSEGTLRVDGERSRAQGFFVARLRRPGGGAEGPVPEEAAPAPRLPGELSPEVLASPTFDPDLLPPGRLALYSGIARFLPERALSLLPSDLAWRGFPLGRLGAGGFQPDARLRACMRADGPALRLETPREIRGLLSGAALQTGLQGREAGLFWRSLPLGRVGLRKGRAIAAFGA